MVNLHTTFMGLPVKSPIIAGSSGLTGNATSIKKLADAGVGAVVLKSLFEEEIIRESAIIQAAQVSDMKGNAEFFDYLDYELKQDALERYATLIREAKTQTDIPVIASINCTTNGEWASYAHKIEQAGADGIELNIMMLGSDSRLASSKVEELHFDIVKSVSKHTSLPLAVKVSPYFAAGASFFKRLSETGIKGVVLFNRFAGFDFDIESGNYTGGSVYSTEHDYSHTLRWVSILSKQVECPITASTGIHSGDTAIKMIMAGAHNMQLTSALYRHGAAFASTIISDIEKWMTKKGYTSLDDFRGCMARSESNRNDMFERVQFMKQFSNHK